MDYEDLKIGKGHDLDPGKIIGTRSAMWQSRVEKLQWASG